MKVFIGLILFALCLKAQTVEATYKVSFGFFGQIGIAKARLHVDEKNSSYDIRMHAYTTGFAKALSGGRKEWFSSEGSVDKNGLFIPRKYEKKVQRESREVDFENTKIIIKEDIKTYHFHHSEKKVLMEKIKKRGAKRHKEKKVMEYYAPNDLLSLFFNFKKLLPSLHVKTPFVLYAMGANEKDGRIDIKPVKDPKHVMDEYAWAKGALMRVVINQEIFASKKGELMVNLNDNGLCQNAVLKDVLFFGDIRGELIDK